jgi:trehalose 6-phosphate phosphatase
MPLLPVPTTAAGRRALAELLADPAGTLLVTDYDGTLAPIVTDPARAVAQPGAVEALVRLAGRLRKVAVVTGRSVSDLLRLGGLDRVPDVIVLGQYGAQRWSGGPVAPPVPPPGLTAARAALVSLIAREPGTALEDKGEGVAVHTRRAVDAEGALDRLRPDVIDIAAAAGLIVEPGRLVLEVRAPGPDKGDAVRALVAELGPRTVLFLGDDAGDLPAFAALAELRASGTVHALLVASASAEEPRTSAAADVGLDGPPAVVELLENLAEALR